MNKLTRTISLFLVLVSLVMILAACGKTQEGGSTQEPKPTERTITPMKAGEYIVDVKGMKPMQVKVTLGETAILAVEVVSHEETPGLSDPALDTIPKKIVTEQNIAVDTISGATMTSQAIIDAVAKAIEQAGGVVDEFRIQP